MGGHRSGCCGRVEEEWRFQTRRSAQPQAQEEACDASQEGGQPIHKGTLRVQSQAGVKDRQGIANEEVQGDDQLRHFRVQQGVFWFRPRWADSPGLSSTVLLTSSSKVLFR